MLNPSPEEGEAEYMLEIFVDVLGLWSSKTDWLFVNSEQLKATTSLEYTITPLAPDTKEQRKVGRISYDADYSEKYSLWIGPYKTEVKVEPNKFLESIQPAPTIGTEKYSNIKRAQPKNLIPEQQQSPLIINPSLKK
jgi:hypothetical protein